MAAWRSRETQGARRPLDRHAASRLAWIDAALDAGEAVPPPSPLEAISANLDYAGWVLSVVAIDPAALDDTAERIDITLPRRVLRRLDEDARAAGETRSGYIAKLALGA